MISKDVVTIEQYLDFLYDVGRSAQRHVPRTHDGQGPLWQLSLRPQEQVLGHIGWHPSQPVVGISVDDATAYCAWLSERKQRKFRLPTELEWEKTSRGAEGRIFPWGDGWESGFAACPEMWPGPWHHRSGTARSMCLPTAFEILPVACENGPARQLWEEAVVSWFVAVPL